MSSTISREVIWGGRRTGYACKTARLTDHAPSYSSLSVNGFTHGYFFLGLTFSSDARNFILVREFDYGNFQTTHTRFCGFRSFDSRNNILGI